MDSAVIGKLIVQELIREPKLYREVIAPALARSKVSSFEIISGYAECACVPLSKVQVSWIVQHDEEEKKKAAENEERAKEFAKQERKMRKRIDDWNAKDMRIYSLNDFPGWLITRIGITRSGAQEELNKAAMDIMEKSPKRFPPYAKDMPTQYAIVKGETFFTESGYLYLIATAKSRGWVMSDEYDQWKAESGLFDRENNED